MGTTAKSKSCTVLHYDEDSVVPTRTYLVLRAWKLHRFQTGGFVEARASRGTWLARQQSKLAEDIAALGVIGGGSGSAEADKKIRLWAPAVLLLK